MRTLRELCGKGFALYSGEDGNAAEFTLQGGDGVISVTSNVAPSTQAKVFAAALNGERESVARLNEPLVSLHQRLFLQANPIPVKWALAAQRRMESGDTAPLLVSCRVFVTPCSHGFFPLWPLTMTT